MNASIEQCPDGHTAGMLRRHPNRGRVELDRPSDDQRIVVHLSHVDVRPRTIRRVNSSTRVSLQMFNVGQAFRRNRYPFKLNHNGNISLSYII
jgi:hypothetical protein